MGNRQIERSMARRLYGEFSKKWRSQARQVGRYGAPGVRKPTFNQWYEMHSRDTSMMKQSTPQDVQEYLGLDPWENPTLPNSDREHAYEIDETYANRGVMTIPISGDGGDDE